MILEPKFWYKKYNIFSVLLIPLSYVYYFVSKLLKIMTTPYVSKIPIVCVGNFTTGGNGKTPTVCFLATYLQNLGFKVCIASRGYKSKISNVKKVKVTDSAEIVGDEALILSKIASCYISKKKKELIKVIEDEENPDIIIMDDGLQNNKIKKSFEIAVVDGLRGLGNYRLLPAGPLREKLHDRVKTLDYIVVIGKDIFNIKSLFPKKVKIVNGSLIPQKLNLNKSLQYIAFSGIGNPQKFFTTLQNYQYNVIKTVAYPDHYFYKYKDLNYLIKIANQYNAKLITTTKDAVKLPYDFKKNVEILAVELIIDNNELLSSIQAILS